MAGWSCTRKCCQQCSIGNRYSRSAKLLFQQKPLCTSAGLISHKYNGANSSNQNMVLPGTSISSRVVTDTGDVGLSQSRHDNTLGLRSSADNMLHSLEFTSDLLTACLNVAFGQLLSPCSCSSFTSLLRCYQSCSWRVKSQHEKQAHSSFVLAALGSSRTSVQIICCILNWMANQHSSFYCKDPITLLPKLDGFQLAQTCFFRSAEEPHPQTALCSTFVQCLAQCKS